ncbi:hypothetical protein [Lentibacillus sp. Marseille-P4043]|uniref:hypothetical protein n=1 Tax=Lentibacillus sp. Marseille-P4043 TaxID=2040293 RepID=UPI000D0B7B2E|nr:hypothetical protein [Lentibacillus sp. Marseille-P4043]
MSTATSNIKRIYKIRKERLEDGALVYCLSDLEIIFSEGLINEVTILYEQGHEPEEIGQAINRDPDEVFIALFHQARQGRINRSFAKRM